MFLLFPLISFIITLVLVPFVIKLAGKYGFVAHPSDNRWHARTTALLGGIAIFLGSFITIWITNDSWNVTIFSLLFSAFLMFVIGLRDDLKPITPRVKLGSQILVAITTISVGIHFSTGLGGLFDTLISAVWIIGVINAINLIDNMDGLSSGVALIASVFIGILGIMANHSFLTVAALSISGACLAFLVYNFKPAKIFMGDCGSLFLGYMLAVLAIMLQSALDLGRGLLDSLYLAVFVLAVPLFDTFLVMVERKRHGRSIARGGKDHTSHRLVYLLGSERKAVLLLYGFGLLFGGMGLFGHYHPGVVKYFIIIFAAILSLLLAYVVIRFAPVYEPIPKNTQDAAETEIVASNVIHGKK